MNLRSHLSLRLRLSAVLPLVLLSTLVSTGLVLPAAELGDPPTVEDRVHVLAEHPVEPGFERTVETELAAQLVGFEWEDGTEGAVEVRVADGEGEGDGEWQRVEGNPYEGPDPTSPEYRGRTTAGPVWLGPEVSEVEVRVVEGELEGLKLHAIRSDRARPGRGARPAGAQTGQPGIVSRAAWGADESFRRLNGCSGQPEYADAVRFSIVHHTATANTYTAADSASIMRAIYHFHTHTSRFCDIGYNFLVDRFGQVFEGRAGGITRAVVGAHASGFNQRSVGVAAIGTFTTAPVPEALYAGVKSLLAWKLAYHGIDPQGQVQAGGRTVSAITGHRDLNPTECPGDNLHPLLGQLRAETASMIDPVIAKPAVQRGNAFYLRAHQNTGPGDASFLYGDTGDIGLFCDWDGDGRRTVGVYRPATASFYLRNQNASGVADVALTYGDPGDTPLCGDWDGNGVDTVGIARAGSFYLRNSNGSGVADFTFTYGDPRDSFLAGDWNGDGVDSPGVVRGDMWYLRNSNTSGVAEVAFPYGAFGDRPVVGDWNGDGPDTPGVVRRGVWFLRNANSPGVADVTFAYGDPSDMARVWR